MSRECGARWVSWCSGVRGAGRAAATGSGPSGFAVERDAGRADAVLPVLRLLLGADEAGGNGAPPCGVAR